LSIADLLDGFEELRHPHVVEIGVVRARHLEEGVVFLPLPLDGEDDVVGVEVARRLERAAGIVPLHALAQMEGINGAVLRDVPSLREARHHIGRSALEIDNAAIDLAIGVERGAGRVHGGIEILRAALGTVDERLGGERRGGQEGRQADGGEKR
jgi:hypothetical protein